MPPFSKISLITTFGSKLLPLNFHSALYISSYIYFAIVVIIPVYVLNYQLVIVFDSSGAQDSFEHWRYSVLVDLLFQKQKMQNRN